MEKPTLSLCMIVKNESDVLATCLESVKDVVNEIIIVDTGSTDNTKEIAERFGAKVYDYQWHFDFASARNFAKKHATSDWVLQLDADERLSEKSKDIILTEIDNAIEYSLNVQILNYDDLSRSYTVHQYPRIYRNVPEIQYEFRIHEQLRYEGQPLDSQDSNVQLLHIGYTTEIVKKKNKIARNKRILQEELKNQPNNAFMHFNLANELMKTKEYKKAIKHYQFAHKHSQQFIVKSASVLQLVKALNHLKQFDQALEMLKEAKEAYQDYTDLWYTEGEILEKMGHDEEAKENYTICLSKGDAPRRYLTTKGIGSEYPIGRLAHLSLKERNFEKALGYYTELTQYNKYSYHHVEKVIGLLLVMFPKEKVIEFLHETYPSGNKKDLEFKNKLAHGFRLYPEFSLLFKETKESFSPLDYSVIDFYLHMDKPVAKEHALTFAKDSKLRAFSFIYVLFTNDKEVKEALHSDKTCRFMMNYLEQPMGEKKKNNYKKEIYIDILHELMKLREYEHIENMLSLSSFFDPRVYIEIADLFYQYSQDDLAIEYYSKYLMKNKHDFAIYVKTANLLYHNKMYEETLLFAEKASQLNQTHFKPVELMIESCRELKLHEATKKIASEYLKAHPHSTYLKNILKDA